MIKMMIRSPLIFMWQYLIWHPLLRLLLHLHSRMQAIVMTPFFIFWKTYKRVITVA
jgi:hypothetical protein